MSRFKQFHEWKITKWYFVQSPSVVIGFVAALKQIVVVYLALIAIGSTNNASSLATKIGSANAQLLTSLFSTTVIVMMVGLSLVALFGPMLYLSQLSGNRDKGITAFGWTMVWLVVFLSAGAFYFSHLPQPKSLPFDVNGTNTQTGGPAQ